MLFKYFFKMLSSVTNSISDLLNNVIWIFFFQITILQGAHTVFDMSQA